MRVHHLNCATMCPRGARLINGTGGLLEPGRMVCHCLLIESDDGLVLVDTGLGLADLSDPTKRLGRSFATMAGLRGDLDEAAVRQVTRLGYAPDDVRHIVLTHLDLDHAGGLPDFPRARVHVFAREHRAAMERLTVLERERYRPHNWAHGPGWELHEPSGERWYGFESVRALDHVGPDVLLIPLPGHSRGHCAVAVRTAERWLLHCGDAYFYHGEVDATGRRCPAGLDLFQRVVQTDGRARLANQARLRDLAREHATEVTLFCAHDPVEYDTLLARSRAASDDRPDGRTAA